MHRVSVASHTGDETYRTECTGVRAEGDQRFFPSLSPIWLYVVLLMSVLVPLLLIVHETGAAGPPQITDEQLTDEQPGDAPPVLITWRAASLVSLDANNRETTCDRRWRQRSSSSSSLIFLFGPFYNVDRAIWPIVRF